MKKIIFWSTIVLIVLIVIVAVFIPPFLRFNSYSHFLDKIDAVKNLKVENFVPDPVQLQMVSRAVYTSNAIETSMMGKEVGIQDMMRFNVFPLSSVRYENLKDDLKKRFGGTISAGGIEGFPEQFLMRFYDKTNRILIMVSLQYAPKMNENSVILYPVSSIGLGIGGIPDTFVNKEFRESILKDLGESKINIDEKILIYSGKGFIVSIFSFTPKSDSLSDEEKVKIVKAENQFELGLLKLLYGK